MKIIAKIFGVLLVLILMNVGLSNPEYISIKIWPFDFEISLIKGLWAVIIFVFSFIAGGFYMWSNNTLKYKSELKKVTRQLKNHEKIN